MMLFFFFFFKQKTAYEIRKGDWSSDVCSSDLPAKLVTQAHGHDGGRTLRITVMKEESAGWQTHNTQHAVQSLRQHALNLAAHKTGSRQIEVGEGQHISFDAAFFFFVERHDHEHGDKRARRGSNHVHAWTLEFRRGIHDVQGDPQNTPG